MKITLPDFLQMDYPQAYLVGGAVRDLIQGLVPTDYDIVVDSNPEQLAENISKKVSGRLVVLGKQDFYLYRIATRRGFIDVTGFKGPDIRSDIQSRDFTINALACPLGSSHVLDYTGGLADLRQKKVRMVSPDSFKQDPARLVRAHRFAACLGFQIDPGTRARLAALAPLISTIAAERIWSEFHLILNTSSSQSQLMEMHRNGLLFAIIPEMIRLAECQQNRHHHKNVLEHTLAAFKILEDLLNSDFEYMNDLIDNLIARIPQALKPYLKLSILLHDVGKPSSRTTDPDGRIHFFGHTQKGASIAEAVCRRLRIANRYRDYVCSIVRHHQKPLDLFLSNSNSPRAFGRFFRKCGDLTPEILLHALADNGAKNVCPDADSDKISQFIYKLYDTYINRVLPLKNQPKYINGHDLMKRFHLPPSPLIGKLLTGLEEAHLSGMIQNRDQAFAWVAEQLSRTGNKNDSPKSSFTPEDTEEKQKKDF